MQITRHLLARYIAIGVTRANGALIGVPVLLHQTQLAVQLPAALGGIRRCLTVDALSLVIFVGQDVWCENGGQKWNHTVPQTVDNTRQVSQLPVPLSICAYQIDTRFDRADTRI